MTMANDPSPALGDLLKDAPSNWGKWGSDDEVGSLNYLGQPEVLEAVRAVRSGKTFTLQTPIGNPDGDPVWPGRTGAQRFMVIDKGRYLAGKGVEFPGGLEYADDYMVMFLRGSTEIAWLDDLAADCAEDGQYDFLYTAAPLKIVAGTGAPVNPIAIK